MPVGMKDLPYDQPGVGALNWGVTVDNAPSWVSKTRDALAKGITTGGNETNFKRLERWAETPQAAKVSPTDRAKWNQFLKGGEYPEGLDPQIALHAVDWALRDKARHDQQKTSFLQDVLGSPITGIAIGALTGGLGAFGSAALSAASGAAVAGGVAGATAVGALTGAATSAAISAGGSMLLNELSPGRPQLPANVVGAANTALSARPQGAGIGGGPSGGGTLLGGTGQRAVDGMGFGGETRTTRTKGAGRAANAPTLLGS